MPCRDYYDDHPNQYFKDVTEPALKKQISFAESALCAVFKALEEEMDRVGNKQSPYDMVNYADAGITKSEFVKWHVAHEELDKKHREQELEAAKKSAWVKLTPLERKALGID